MCLLFARLFVGGNIQIINTLKFDRVKSIYLRQSVVVSTINSRSLVPDAMPKAIWYHAVPSLRVIVATLFYHAVSSVPHASIVFSSCLTSSNHQVHRLFFQYTRRTVISYEVPSLLTVRYCLHCLFCTVPSAHRVHQGTVCSIPSGLTLVPEYSTFRLPTSRTVFSVPYRLLTVCIKGLYPRTAWNYPSSPRIQPSACRDIVPNTPWSGK